MPDFTASNRLIAIDLARGIAMLGVALVNVHTFAAVFGTVHGLDLAKSASDVVAEYVVTLLFTHRSYPVLAFLFGVGLAWQWQRISIAGGTPKALRPRLWALLIIGFAHGLLLWPGEILATYALVGLVVTHAFLDCDERWPLHWAIGALVLSFSISALLALGATVRPPEPWPIELTGSSFAASVWSDAQRLRVGEFFGAGLLQISSLNLWWAVLLGVWAGRSGFLSRFFIAPFANRLLGTMGFVCLIGGAWIALFFSARGGWNVLNADWLSHMWMSLAFDLAAVSGLWMWLTISACWGRSRYADSALASLVVATGRAPLTQFIGQSIVFALLFNKSLIGWHGELGRAAYSLIAVATYLLLCAFIRAWLASGHAHGPMEIVWRWLTKILSSPRGKSTESEGLAS